MKTEQLTVRELFEPAIRYQMPETQREYVWSQRRQWEPLWDDVRDTAEAHLRNAQVIKPTHIPQQYHRAAHFLGPVVLQVKSDELAGKAYTKTVIDGQQRLTTLQLLLNAARVITKLHYSPTSKTLETYIANNSTSWPDADPDYQYKIWSDASELDRSSFTTIINETPLSASQLPPDPGTNPYPDSLIIEAHEYFKNRISDWLGVAEQNNIKAYCEALQHTLLGLLTVITIEVRNEDDPQLIYETLNARGTSLLQSDLIKNRLIGQAEASAPDWPFNNDEWWHSKPEEDSQNRHQADIFLHHWVTMRTKDVIFAQDVYDTYRKFTETTSMSPKVMLDDITKTAAEYKYREVQQDPLYTFLKSTTSPDIVSIILWILVNENFGNQQNKALLALSSFIARRRISGKPTTGEPMKGIINTWFSRVFINRNVGQSGDRMVEHLRDISLDAPLEWPDDERLEHSFREQPLYITSGPETVRAILRGLETRMRIEYNQTKHPEADLLELTPPMTVFSVEHILPKVWSEYWPTAIDDKNRRDTLVNTIGNLTLVTPDLNNKLANKAWTDKRQMISLDSESSQLLLNKALFMSEYSHWDEEAIAKRSRTLFETALRVWLSPHSTAWN